MRLVIKFFISGVYHDCVNIRVDEAWESTNKLKLLKYLDTLKGYPYEFLNTSYSLGIR
jgi:hypothetical protein